MRWIDLNWAVDLLCGVLIFSSIEDNDDLSSNKASYIWSKVTASEALFLDETCGKLKV